MKVGDWSWSLEHRQICRVLDVDELWGNTHYRVWLPSMSTVELLAPSSLTPLSECRPSNPAAITYVAAAARVADARNQGLLLAPLRASVLPLPHQIRALSRALSGNRVRYLLADEVGLGKTIEAGLILRELKLRGRVKRTLIVVPRGLATQWVGEMRTHFGEEFKLLIPSDLLAYRRIAGDGNPWSAFPQVICPMDSVKPLDRRRGWSDEQVAEYNQERFEDLVSAGWDLVIVDEAHRLGGSTEQIARYRLGEGLADAAPYLLLLSATPHQGKTDAFHRLVSLLDSQAFPDQSSVTRERIRPYVIRTEKRHAVDVLGQPLFKPRHTRLMPVSWEEHHRGQRALYEAVTSYVREGYNQALREKKSYLGFLMLLMQRLVTSSTRAIRVTLERRLDALRAPTEQLSLFPVLSEEEWAEMDGQEQLDTLLNARLKAFKSERAEVELLLEAARHTEAYGPDAKAEALLELIYRQQQEEGDPALKVLTFTEFVPTQQMLRDFLRERGFSVVCLNGSMDLEERRRVQEAFAGEAQVLISTDAGGEGLNLQFCHVVVNYDIPWNPMKLEQRIGRVDRIGQSHPVRAANFLLQGTVEYRVREVLEEKLAVILKDFGVDKLGDVLDSAQAGRLFEELQMDALLHPEELDARIYTVVARIQEQARAIRESSSVFSADGNLDPAEARRVMDHPLSHWVERMTVSYLEAQGGRAERQGRVWSLVWPEGDTMRDVVFTTRDLEAVPAAHPLTLDDGRVRELATRLPQVVPGQPLPVVSLSDLPPEVLGLWSLWRVAISRPTAKDASRDSEIAAADRREILVERVMPLFLHDDGRVLAPTARHLWDQLLAGPASVTSQVAGGDALQAFDAVRRVAEAQGRLLFDELVRAHGERLAGEREKGEHSFAARRRAIGRVGLPAVRAHRLARLEAEERAWREQLSHRAEVTPELVPLQLIRVEGTK